MTEITSSELEHRRRAELLQFVQQDLQDCSKEAQASGWEQKAILGSIAVLTGVLLDNFESKSSTLLLASLIITLLNFSRTAIPNLLQKHKNPQFEKINTYLLKDVRYRLLVDIGISGFLIYSILCVSLPPSKIYWPLILGEFFWSCILIVMIALSHRRLSLSKYYPQILKARRHEAKSKVLFYVFQIYSIYVFYRFSPFSAGAHTIKASLSLVAIIELAKIYAEKRETNFKEQSLNRIRRQLLFSRKDLRSIEQRLKIINNSESLLLEIVMDSIECVHKAIAETYAQGNFLFFAPRSVHSDATRAIDGQTMELHKYDLDELELKYKDILLKVRELSTVLEGIVHIEGIESIDFLKKEISRIEKKVERLKGRLDAGIKRLRTHEEDISPILN